jgi:trehalose 6-phosphate phosphatase
VRITFAQSGVRGSSNDRKTDDEGGIALFLDVDGTLLDLAERPDEVTVPAGLIPTVAAARAKAGGALALVSGRKIADLDRLFAPLRLSAAGVHGAELRLDPGAEPLVAPGVTALPSDLWTAVNAVVKDFPGTFVENKRYSYTVHYRQLPVIGPALRERIARLLETQPQSGITMLEAHCAFELKRRQFDKGEAVSAFLAVSPFLGRKPIFIGDDDTDEAGFAVVSARGGRAYSVGRRRPGVEATFADPSAVRRWLAAFAGVDAAGPGASA